MTDVWVRRYTQPAYITHRGTIISASTQDLAIRQQSYLRGALLIITAELCFAVMGACVRQAAETLDNAAIVFFRNLFSLFLLLLWLRLPGLGQLRTTVWHLHLLRGLAGLSAMYCFYYAIIHLPLANAMLLKLSSPLFIPFVALLWLHERLTLKVLAAVLIGFAGVAVIFTPAAWPLNDDGSRTVVWIALAGGVFAAIAKVTVRRLSQTEPTVRTVFYFAAIGGIASAVPLPWVWITPDATTLGWLLGVAVSATLGQLALTRGLGLAPAGRLAPFSYFSVLFAAAIGWLIWSEPLTTQTLLGALLVVGAGWLVSLQRPNTAAEPAPGAEPPPQPPATAGRQAGPPPGRDPIARPSTQT